MNSTPATRQTKDRSLRGGPSVWGIVAAALVLTVLAIGVVLGSAVIVNQFGAWIFMAAVALLILLVVAGVLMANINDIQRYLKIRRM